MAIGAKVEQLLKSEAIYLNSLCKKGGAEEIEILLTSDLECTDLGKFLYFSFIFTQKWPIYTGNPSISYNFGYKWIK